MDGICVVPEQPEIHGSGLHCRKPLDYEIGIYRSGRVAVLRNTPHSLDRSVVRDQALYFRHIGAVALHRYVNHANAIVFANFEMAVIAGNWAEEGDFALF